MAETWSNQLMTAEEEEEVPGLTIYVPVAYILHLLYSCWISYYTWFCRKYSEIVLTINVLLILQVGDIFFFMREKHLMGPRDFFGPLKGQYFRFLTSVFFINL